MTLPLQVVIADPALRPTVEAVLARRAVHAGGGVVALVWDERVGHPESAARVARQARALLETTGARGEGGFARLVVGGAGGGGGGNIGSEAAPGDGPAPVVTLRIATSASAAGAMQVPEAIGPRLLGTRERLEAVAHLVGLIADLAGGARAREAFLALAEAVGEGALALAGAARFEAATLREALAARMVREVAARIDEAYRAGRATGEADPRAVAPPFPEAVAIDARIAEPLGARVSEDGAELARRLAGDALEVASEHSTRLRREVEHALATSGFGAIEPMRAMIEGALREVEARLAGVATAPVARLVAPSRAALEAAERAMAEVPPAIRGTWPLEAAGALGGATVAAVAIAPLAATWPVPALVPGGGATVVAGAALALWGLTAVGARLAQAIARRRARHALASAEAAYADAWRAAARTWMEPVAALGTRRALARLAAGLGEDRARLRALAAAVDALVGRGAGDAGRAAPAGSGPGLDVAVDLGPAREVLAEPPEPLYRRVEAEFRSGMSGALMTPGALADAARAAYAGLADGLPLDARSDLAQALRGPTRAAMTALRDELGRWLPDGVPARRFVALPSALADAAPDGARLDDRLTSAGDGWVLVLWRAP